jgi:hypothetical protein
MQRSRNLISIWFFIGVLLLIYGAAILGAGLMDSSPSAAERTVVLAELHAQIWWGVLLLIIGAVYTLKFSPWRRK